MTSCLTLAPVINLQAGFATTEEKRALSRALFYLSIGSTGDDGDDIRILANAIDRLVIELGLKTGLEEYGVPGEDLAKIAYDALRESRVVDRCDERFESLVKMLEGLYLG